MAEQTEPVRRKVALKVLKAGMDTRQVVARFEAERQALAIMDHPNIARVFDGGATATGRPFFVMELVRGVAITDYCDQNHLTPRERLELFATVCQSVQHAHQKGLIHRDLKPSNVLVSRHDTTPIVKIIDFGVAKALGQSLTDKTLFTGIAQMIGTPMYMSPEQAGMSDLDVDTRSDIYSLGVLLYELLTGTTPFDKEKLKNDGFDEMRRIIREEEPETVSNRIARTRNAERGAGNRGIVPHSGFRAPRWNELDWIVMKALEKDRSRRYDSASALAADIQRYLSDEPVLACPPTAMYRFQKFARKHKASLTTAAAIAVCLVVGTTISAWQAVRATEAEGQAKEATAAEAQQRQRAEANEQTAVANAAAAKEKEQEAVLQRDEVKKLNDKLRQTLYAAHMNLAHSAWHEAALPRVLDLLEQHLPKTGEKDLRGFEWHYLYRLCHAELLTIKTNTNWNWSIAYSPDGKHLAGASDNNTLKVWDAQTGAELLSCKGHARGVVSVSYSPDGKRLASASEDKTLKLWDAQTGQELLTFKGAAGNVSFSPDGKLVAGSSGDIRVWDAQTGQELLAITGGGSYAVFSPDGKRLASVDSTDTVKVWDAQTGKELLSLKGRGRSVVFSPDGNRLATSAGGDVKVSDAQTGEELLTLKGGGRNVVFSPDGKRLAGVSDIRTVKVWDSETGEQLFSLKGHANSVPSVVFSPNGTRLASASVDGTIRVWDAINSPEARTVSDPTGIARSAIFSPDGKRLASTYRDSTTRDSALKVWDAQSGQELLSIKGQADESFLRVTISPDGKRLAAGTGTLDKTKNEYVAGAVKLWDAQTGRELVNLKAYAGGVDKVVFTPDGKRLASAGVGFWNTNTKRADGEVKMWDAETGRELISFRGHSSSINDLAFSADGKRLATQFRDSTVKIWDAATGEVILTLTANRPPRDRDGVAFSPDGMRLASSCQASNSGSGPGAEGEVIVWDTRTGQQLFTLKGHTAGVSSVVYSPDGKRLASASGTPAGSHGSGEVKVWDANTGEELLTLKGGGYGQRMAFSPNGYLLATDAGGTVKIYDATPLPEKP